VTRSISVKRPAPSQHLMCSGDGLGTPNSILGRTEPKKHLGRRLGAVKLSGVPQIALGDTLRDVTEDASKNV
jgi:hypothetical protein